MSGINGVGGNDYEAKPDTINSTVKSQKEMVIQITTDSTNNDGIGLMRNTMDEMQRKDFNLEEYMEKLRQQYPIDENEQKPEHGV